MDKKSIKKNYLFNLMYQTLLILIPFVTTPYVSRVLGADGIGKASFIESIVSYFLLLATLGISTYGQRELSYLQDDFSKRTKVFWEIKILQFITSGCVFFFYILFSLFQEDKTFYLIFSINILAVFVDVVWLFQGMEEFGKIVLKNLVFKLINVAYIFLIIKDRGDLAKYIFGSSFFLFAGNLSLWTKVPKYVGRINIKEIRPFKNIKEVLSLFVPTIAIQIYTVLDKTMIGLISKDAFENGYYEQAIKLSKMVLIIVASLGTVMIPRIGYHYGRHETDIVNNYMYRSYRFVWFLGIPLCFGLFGVSSNFVPWFFGDGYDKVSTLLKILCFLILAIGINTVTGNQYLIPTKQQKVYTITVILGAVVNFFLNLVLIYFYKSVGAAVASVVAETVIAVSQLLIIRKEIRITKILKDSINYFIAGIIMLFLLLSEEKFLQPGIVNTFIMVLSGALVYFFVLLIIRDSFLFYMIKVFLSKIKSVIKREEK